MPLDSLVPFSVPFHQVPIQESDEIIRLAGASVAPVLLVGGYRADAERVARAIHRHSAQAGKPLVMARCGLYRGTLLENRFFGRSCSHAKARVRRANQPGLVEAARGGMLFVEQLQLATPLIQDQLLRLLTGRTFFDPLSKRVSEPHVRVMASVPVRMDLLVRAGRILPDLAERLSALVVHVPGQAEPAGRRQRAATA